MPIVSYGVWDKGFQNIVRERKMRTHTHVYLSQSTYLFVYIYIFLPIYSAS